VGHLLTTIDQLGLYDNTLVLILSDHGVNLGEHGYIGKGVIRNRALQNIPLFPEMSRIPMLARFPGCRPGSTIDALVQPVHLAATVLDFLGRRIPPAFSAPSLWPLLERKVSTVADIVVSAPRLSPESDKRLVPCPTDRASITDGRWVLIYSCAGWADELKKKRHDPAYQDKRRAPLTGELLVPLLFDMQSDPECLRDVYPQNRERAVDMHQQFFAFLQSSPMIPEHLDFFRKLEND
jgi:arylsulfatase A-like enzyme